MRVVAGGDKVPCMELQGDVWTPYIYILWSEVLALNKKNETNLVGANRHAGARSHCRKSI
jgi:hypothetical protein